MAASQSPEQRELSLVGKVEMRIALADSDTKLESALKTYLAPLLLKLASEHQSVRNKVVTVCQHVNTRIKPQSIQLPVAALVQQFKDQENSMIRHFYLLYVQQGIGRLSSAEKKQLLPVVVSGISRSGSQGHQIFNLLLRLLEFFDLPPRGSKDDLDLRTRLEVSEDDVEYLSMRLGKLILFNPQKGANPKCAGLSSEDYNFLTLQSKEGVWQPASGGLNLLRTKTLAARFLASGLFNDRERFLPALFASADGASNVSDVGDDMMKRALPVTDLEDEGLIKQLYTLYFGTEEMPRVRPPLRLKILGLFNKSIRSTTFSSEIMKLVDDGISSPAMDGEDVVMSNATSGNTNIGREATKVRSAIFTYINFAARHGSKDSLYAIASRVINRLRDFIENQGWPKVGANEDLVSRGYAYEVTGLLAKAGPRSILVEEDNVGMDLLRWLFNSLAKDTSGNSIIVSIEEALSTVLSALSRLQLSSAEQSVLEDLLIEQMEQSADLNANKRIRSTRFVALRFANRCLPYSSVKARWVDILGLGAKKDRAEVHEEAERGLSPYWYRMLNGFPGASTDEHDSHEQVKEQFQNTWDDSVGGSRIVLLYLSEILELCMANLDSAQWTLKHTSAKAVASAMNAVASSESTMSEKVGEQMWPAIEKALSGKTWDGKEEVLLAFVKFVETGRGFYNTRPAILSSISKIALREAKRQNATYRRHSVAALGQVALARDDVDMHESVFDVVKPLLETSADKDAMDVDNEQPRAAGDIVETTHVAAIEAMFASINPTTSEAKQLNGTLTSAINLVASMSYHPANVRRAYYGSLLKVFDRIRLRNKGQHIDFDLTGLRTTLFGSDVEIEALRLLRADAILSIGKTSPSLTLKMQDDISALLADEKSSNVRDRLAQLH